MITLAIGVKDPSSSRCYRQMLTDTGFESHFAMNVAELARIVKARPIDVVVFDLGISSMPVDEWLGVLAQDVDLGLTPILWVGTNIPKDLNDAVEAHRPGIWLKAMPKTEDLMASVLHLIGRQVDTGPIPISGDIPDSHEWIPKDDLIDDALQIFDEGSKAASATASQDQPVVTQAPVSTGSKTPSPRTGSVPTGDSAKTSYSDSASTLEVDEVRTTHLTDPRRQRATGSQPRRAVVASHSPGGARTVNLDPAMVERITNDVVDRILKKLASQLDNDFIRNEIQAAVRERVR